VKPSIIPKRTTEGEIGRKFFRPINAEDFSMNMIIFVRQHKIARIHRSLSVLTLNILLLYLLQSEVMEKIIYRYAGPIHL
jgi:hypothetical protein